MTDTDLAVAIRTLTAAVKELTQAIKAERRDRRRQSSSGSDVGTEEPADSRIADDTE